MNSVKVEVEDVSSVRRKIHVELPTEVVDEAFEEAYRELKKTARLKGFRPGKAPRSLLERYYGDKVRYDVTTKLFQESYTKSIREKALSPVSQPNIEDMKLRPGEEFRYTAMVEVKPRVGLSDYVGLEAHQEEVRVTDKQVRDRLDEIREMFARLEDVTPDRPVQEGDVVVTEHQLLIEGQPLGNREPQEEMLEIRSDRLDEALYKSLVGVRLGEEAEVPRQFSPDEPDPSLAGKEGVLRLKVKSIRQKILPELDDHFAQRMGEYTSLEDLRVTVREELEETERRRIISDMNQALIEQLLERHPIEVPEAMVELQIEQMIRNAKRRLAVHGLTMEQAGSNPEEMRARFRDSAVGAVRTTLILEAIADREGIQVADQDLNEAYEKIAKQTGRDVQAVKGLYRNSDASENLKASLLEEKTLDFLRDKANIVKKRRAGSKKRV
jgi:trigger factor